MVRFVEDNNKIMLKNFLLYESKYDNKNITVTDLKDLKIIEGM